MNADEFAQARNRSFARPVRSNRGEAAAAHTMDVFYRKEDIEQHLADAFRHRYRRKDVALTGILLARPEDRLTKEEILPHLGYWHHRSDNVTDFYCAGYIPTEFVGDAPPIGVTIDGLEWGFSMRAYVEILEDVEQKTGWRSSGDPCLLLLNSYFDGQTAHLDYLRGLRINLREAIADKAFDTPTQLAELVFDFAKQMNEDANDPVWQLSDRLGRRVLKRSFKDILLSSLPKALNPRAREAFHYVVYESPNVA